MKNIIIIIVVFFTLTLTTQKVFSQTGSESTWTVRYGENTGSTASCPIPNGILTCGSKFTPAGGCAHCSQEYINQFLNGVPGYCATDPGAQNAIDIGSGVLQDVILPSVNNGVITWTNAGETIKSGIEAIIYWSGVNDKTGEKYWIQFHHSQPGSGGTRGNTRLSGNAGAKTCNGCIAPHTHVQFAHVGSSGKVWQDAARTFCGQ